VSAIEIVIKGSNQYRNEFQILQLMRSLSNRFEVVERDG